MSLKTYDVSPFLYPPTAQWKSYLKTTEVLQT